MKKHNNEKNSPQRTKVMRKTDRLTIGMDLGDKTSRFCAMGSDGEIVQTGTTATTRKGMTQTFATLRHCRIAIEVGAHSRWVSRLLKSFGHEVFVANARQIKLISASSRKDDKLDAEMLARLARVDPELLRPIRHRGEEAQMDLTTIRVRAALLEARTGLVNTVRGIAKAAGERLPPCDADQMGAVKAAALPDELRGRLLPLLEEIEALTQRVKQCDQELEQIARDRYPETACLRQIYGVGLLMALTFVVTLEDKQRFSRSRDVGCYLGLRPKRSESGERQPELRITKEGDPYLRKLLVQSAHCILSGRSPDTDLKRWGSRLAQRGGKNARKRAIVAMARKLAVLLHHLWVSGEVYEPLRNSRALQAAA
jgi:transposase